MTYEPWDVVVVPFPFTDRTSSKRRPALVLSSLPFNSKSGHLVLAMITSAENSGWPLDVTIQDVDVAGILSASVVRMKLFTLDQQLIQKRVGSIGELDRRAVLHSMQGLFNLMRT